MIYTGEGITKAIKLKKYDNNKFKIPEQESIHANLNMSKSKRLKQ